MLGGTTVFETLSRSDGGEYIITAGTFQQSLDYVATFGVLTPGLVILFTGGCKTPVIR